MSVYQVILPVFQGPLDLLLHLIQEQELEITQVSLATVTDQYLSYLSQVEKIQVENLAEFILVAAQLLLIKSRALLPRPAVEEEMEEDIGQELVQKLLEYKRYKAAALELRARENEGLRAYPRIAPFPEKKKGLPLEGISLQDLAKMVQLAFKFPPLASADEVVAPLKITLPEKIAELKKLMVRKRELSFRSLLAGATSRLEIIVTFLAILQLIKDRKISVRQDQLYDDILIFPRRRARAA
ncbi:MAG: segregation/condensation protein A [Chloroflexi bacterium]|nr:segregation/condensation protein A [Chloroflexota bacterium]